MVDHPHDIWTIIVTHNGQEWVNPLLDSLEASTPPMHVLVVDNRSTDQTVAMVRSRPGVQLIALKQNLGFGGANNHGIRVALDAGAKYVFLLNQDAAIYPDTLAHLLDAVAMDPTFGLLAPVQMNYEGTRLDPYFLSYMCREESCSFFSDLYCHRLKKTYPVSFINAAAWLIRREVLERVGGFDPVFFMYGEDNDLCQRIRAAGWKVGVVASARFRHWHGGHDCIQRPPHRRTLTRYNTRIFQLKDTSTSLGRAVLRAARRDFNELVLACLASRWSEARIILCAWINLLPRLSAIRRSRHICLHHARPFLDEAIVP